MDQATIKLLEQGFALQQQGDLAQAKDIYLSLLAKDPDNVYALNLLGVVSIHQKDFHLAIDYLQSAIAIDNSDAESFSNLGLAYQGINKFSEAQGMFERSLSINSQQPVVLNNLGNVFACQNLHEKALYCFDQAMRIDNRYIDCLNNMFVSLKELKQYDKALHIMDYALTIDNNNSRTVTNKGEIYKIKADYQQAKLCFERAISIDNNIVAKIQLSSVLKLLAEEQSAKKLLKAVLSIEPHNVEANNQLGVLLEQLGEFEQAAYYFRQALTFDDKHASAYFQLSKMKNTRLTEAEIARVIQLIKDESTLDLFKSSLYLALAWEYDKQKQYYNSMECFIEGNGIKAKSNPYDLKSTQAYIDFCQITYPVQIDSQISQSELLPIFIIGMPRSGTTLTEQMLASHSLVFGAGEVGYINELTQLATKLTNQRYPNCITALTSEHIVQLRQNYLNKMKTQCGSAKYVVDKNPLNYHSVGFISLIFPEAKFVYCLREPLDNCVSIFKLPFDDNQTYSHDLTSLGIHYQMHVKLMRHWLSCYPEQIFVNHYEQMIDKTDKQVSDLLCFIGLPFESSVINFHENKRIVLTPSAEQVRQPIYRSSVGIAQRYGQLLSPLIDSLAISI